MSQIIPESIEKVLLTILTGQPAPYGKPPPNPQSENIHEPKGEYACIEK